MCILSICIAYSMHTVADARSVWVEVEYRRPFSGVPSVTTLSFRRPPSATTFNFFRTTLSCDPVNERPCFSQMSPSASHFLLRTCRSSHANLLPSIDATQLSVFCISWHPTSLAASVHQIIRPTLPSPCVPAETYGRLLSHCPLSKACFHLALLCHVRDELSQSVSQYCEQVIGQPLTTSLPLPPLEFKPLFWPKECTQRPPLWNSLSQRAPEGRRL